MTNKPWLKFYDAGVPPALHYPDVPFFHFLEESARRYPDTACTIFRGETITYREMDRRTNRLAAALVRLGVQKGDRVGVLLPNSPEFVLAYFGILKAGGVVAAVNPLYTPPEIEHPLNDAGVRVILTGGEFYARLKSLQSRTRLQTVIAAEATEALQPRDYDLQSLIDGQADPGRPPVHVTPDDVAIFQYSGGTTGVPKAAVATHRNLTANVLQLRAWFINCYDGHETMLVAIPLYHVYGMVLAMGMGIRMAAPLALIPDPRDLSAVLAGIQTNQATIFPGVPTIYNAINHHPEVQGGKYNLRSLKACISGSAPLRKETKDTFEALTGAKLFEGYGLSEAPTATHCNPLVGLNKPGSIGVPLPDVEARIVDLEDDQAEMPTGQAGELALRGPQVMQGYHNMPGETGSVLRGGWLLTGDIARMDEDGFFYIMDRKKELIKPGGFQVWPREVEEAIAANPKVLDVGVAGVPDPYRGETVKAWVVLKPGERADAEEIIASCRDRLARYKLPTEVEFVPALPRTPVGKLLRRELVRRESDKR